jgi:tryptophan synthase alpha chain
MPPSLIAYFPLADAVVPTHLLDVYAAAGVDIVEFGWPARDPYLDGPDVRASMARAAEGDARAAFIAARERLSTHGKGLKALVMTYSEQGHPALRDPDFFRNVDAALVVGPPGSAFRLALETRARKAGAGIAAFLPLPLASDDIAAATRADCYAMLQAAPGLTGPRRSFDAGNKARVAELRAKGVTAPIVLGFGISSGAQAHEAIACGADGVVVGSAVLRAALQGRGELEALLGQLREGLDA